MKPIIIIAIAFVLLVPVSVFAQSEPTLHNLFQQLNKLEKQEKFHSGLRLVEQIIVDYPDNFDAKVLRCVFLLNAEYPSDEVESCLDKVSTTDPDNILILFSYGTIYTQRGDFVKAKEVFWEVWQDHPTNKQAEARYYTILLVMDSNDVDSLNKLKEIYESTKDLRILNNIINFHNERYEFLESEKLLKYAMEIDDKNPITLTNYGAFYALKDNFSSAERYFLEALDEDENDLIILNNLGLLYRDLGDKFESIEHYQSSIGYYTSALDADKENSFAEYGIGYSTIKIQEIKNAEFIFNVGLVVIGVFATGIFTLIGMYVRLQQDKKSSETTKNKDEKEKLIKIILRSEISLVIFSAVLAIPMALIIFSLGLGLDIVKNGDVLNWASMTVEVGIGITVAILILVYELRKNDKFKAQQTKIEKIVEDVNAEQSKISTLVKDVKKIELKQDKRESEKVDTENRFYKLNLLPNIQSLMSPIQQSMSSKWSLEEDEEKDHAKYNQNIKLHLEEYGYWADRIININSNTYVPPEIRDSVRLLVHQAIKPISFNYHVFEDDFLEKTVFNYVLKILESNYIKNDLELDVKNTCANIMQQINGMKTIRDQFREISKS